MSFDLNVGSFHGGEPKNFSASVLTDAIQPFIVGKEPNCYVLSFDGIETQSCDLYVNTEANEISDFSVNRPVSDLRLYAALFQVLQTRGTVLYMSGACPPLVGIPESMEELPQDMVESLGKPCLVAQPEAIPEWIKRA